MGLWQEFKQFAVKGSVIDLAVGVIIGAAFGKITSSLVEDVIMPPLSVLLGKVDLSNLFIVMPGQEDKVSAAMSVAQKAGLDRPTFAQFKAAGVSVLTYGQFLNNVIQFFIIAFAVFLLVHSINKLKKVAEPEAAPSEPITKDCPFCFQTIPVKAVRCPFCTSELESV